MTGSQSAIQQIKKLVENGERITIKTRDLLLLNAIVDIYERLETISAKVEDLQPALRFYKLSMWVITAIAGALITLAVSGRVEIVIK